MALFKTLLQRFSSHEFELFNTQPAVLLCVFMYAIMDCISRFNLLIVQLTRAYDSIYEDVMRFVCWKRINSSEELGVGEIEAIEAFRPRSTLVAASSV